MSGDVEAQAHILVVDDDRRIRELLRAYLIENGYRVSLAADAAAARAAMTSMVHDLVVLDIMMPGESGIVFAQSLRQAGATIPILMLSALADVEDRVRGLKSGSDDYLAKPFEPMELLLRIQSLLRRVPAEAVVASRDVRFGAYLFNIERGELRENGQLVRLTGREREMLRHLARTPGKPASRESLGSPDMPDSARAVDVQMTRLRQKIEADPANPVHILTVRGEGYVLQVDRA